MRLKKASITLLSVLLLCSCTKTVQDKSQELVNEETHQEAAELSEVQTENTEEEQTEEPWEERTEDTEEEPHEVQEEVHDGQAEFPEHLRPEGYDDPVLTKEVAKEILLEAREMQIRMLFGGLYEGLDVCPEISPYLESERYEARTYIDFEKGWYETDGHRIVYYVPELGTYEKFFDCFCRVFTDESVLEVVIDYDLALYDDRLTLCNFGYNHLIFERAWSNAYVSEVKQEKGSNTATVFAVAYDSESGAPMEMEYTFKFSEKYGWRVEIKYIQLDM